ncbi:MAG: NF038143 family protein [Deltaproteobacteria bacterium]|nr:MAG: NF038143 family protein [Deltaproteobacteria bacterium]
MRKILPTVLDTKYESILSRERSLAKAVASAVIESKPLTVWEMMIPLVFIHNFLRYKRTREVFTLNFLFTKKLALEAAFDTVKKGQSRQQAMARIKEKTRNILAADKKGIYSQKIRQRQMKEIELLIEHYRTLLQAEGKDYNSMMKNAYRTWEEYSAFLEQIRRAEKEVNRAAQQTVRVATASDLVSKMEKATERIRRSEAGKIFEINS